MNNNEQPENKLKNWYSKSKDKFTDWFSQDTQKEIILPQCLEDIRPEINDQLNKLVKNLSPCKATKEKTRKEIITAIKEWQKKPDQPGNSLTILSNSVESSREIITESLGELSPEINLPITCLEWLQRPKDINKIAEKLRQQLGKVSIYHQEKLKEIVVIPSLEWCFLRSVLGLNGIDSLKKNILADSSRFWIISCNQIAWNYLNCVFQLHAYCPRTFVIPSLDSEELEAWLTPVMEEINVNFDLDPDQAPDKKTEFFQQLKVVSQGLSTVAAQLLRYSLAFDSSKLVTTVPTLPKLPDLSLEDHYLLYSLLLHQEITLEHLAVTLGDPPATVQNGLQKLYSQGIIEEDSQLFRLNPLYYPRVKEELDGNNFYIGE